MAVSASSTPAVNLYDNRDSQRSVVWSENFDSQRNSFLLPQSKNTKWTVAKALGYQDFTFINPEDAGSLSVKGPDDVTLRETSEALSEPMVLPAGAELDFWVGCSLHFTRECSLEVALLIDAEKTEPLWTSLELEDPVDWQWRHVALPLTEYEGKTVRIVLRYTYGTLDYIDMLGGYQGSFMIDDIRVTENNTPGPVTPPAVSPQAAIATPGSMTDNVHRIPLMPPLQPLTFTYSGSGTLLNFNWSAKDAEVHSGGQSNSYTISFPQTGNYEVSVTASNELGSDRAALEVLADWHGTVCNMIGNEQFTSHISGSDHFPSSSLAGIGAYAERYTPPANVSVTAVHLPVLTATNLPQSGSLVIRLTGDADGFPGGTLSETTLKYSDIEAHTPDGVLADNIVTFSVPVVTDKPFHVVVSGFPQHPAQLVFGASGMRADNCQGAMFRGGQWVKAPASLAFMPEIYYSGIYRTDCQQNPPLQLDSEKGVAYVAIFSAMPFTASTSADWLRVTSPDTPGEHQLAIAYDRLPSKQSRTGYVTLSDGIGQYRITLIQSQESSIDQFEATEMAADCKQYIVPLTSGAHILIITDSEHTQTQKILINR